MSLGSILLLAALGLAITFGLLGVINMAHGEMLMLGAYATYVVQIMFQRYAPAPSSSIRWWRCRWRFSSPPPSAWRWSAR
jgi:branched-subunit amino acid ABC-type transport system permease component